MQLLCQQNERDGERNRDLIILWLRIINGIKNIQTKNLFVSLDFFKLVFSCYT